MTINAQKPLTLIETRNEKHEEYCGYYEGQDRDYLIVGSWNPNLGREEATNFLIINVAALFWPENFEIPVLSNSVSLTESEKLLQETREKIKDKILEINKSLNPRIDECYTELETYKGFLFFLKRRGMWLDRLEGSECVLPYYEKILRYNNLKKLGIAGCSCDIKNKLEVIKLFKKKGIEVDYYFSDCLGDVGIIFWERDQLIKTIQSSYQIKKLNRISSIDDFMK